jgi:hypothetical protein
MTGPQITLGRLALPGGEVFDGCFIDLHVAVDELFGLHRLDHGLEPLSDEGHGIGHRLAGEFHSVPLPVDLLLAIEGKVVGVFADDDVGEQTPERGCRVPGVYGKRATMGRGFGRGDLYILRPSRGDGAGSGRVRSRVLR